jgi:3' terminal RNA ribose 2'-O-methyltransferase Hen1
LASHDTLAFGQNPGQEMILILSSYGPGAKDLSFSLRKNPFRLNVFNDSLGRILVFFVSYEPEKASCAMVMEIDPIPEQKSAKKGFQSGRFDYISITPYAATSLLSVAISRVFGTAMAGTNLERPELNDQTYDLEAYIPALPCPSPKLASQFFEPLNYSVKVTQGALDDKFPSLGPSPLVALTVRGRATVSAFLRHLYILLPALGGRKHYYIGSDEVDKLLRGGQGWLSGHPRRDQITSQYLGRYRALTRVALDRLENGEGGAMEEISGQASHLVARKTPLSKLRQEVILDTLKGSDAKSVLDYGCGEGSLLVRLIRMNAFAKVGGLDLSAMALSRAKSLIERAFNCLPANVRLYHGSVTYFDEGLIGYEAVVCQEVIEHLDPPKMEPFREILFGRLKPALVIVTTPNAEYNVNFPFLEPGHFRHPDHQFELDRASFKHWAERVANDYGYSVQTSEIGETDPETGRPSQLGIFTKCS